MRTHRRIAVGAVAAATAALLTLAGCASAAPQSDQGADRTFRYIYNTVIVTDLDPATHASSEQIVLRNVYETLTNYDAQAGEVVPGLATEWSASDDGLTWTFTLRDDAVFHSGRAVDATAVKESIDRTIELGGGLSYIWDSVNSIEAPSATELVFTLDYPAPLDLVTSAGYAAYVYDIEAAGDEDLAEWFNAGNDAGSGPYELVDYQKGSDHELRIEAFEDYPGGWADDQYTAVDFIVSPEQTTSWQMLQNGEGDFIFNLRPELFNEAKNNDSVNTFQIPSFTNSFAFLNTASGPLADIKVREALSKTLDLDAVAKLMQGAGTPASGMIPEGLTGHFDDLGITADLDEAKRLFEAAGYGPSGQSLSLDVTFEEGNENLQSLATYWTSVLAPLNVTLNTQALQWTAVYDQAVSPDASARQDIVLSGWWPDAPDANSWYYNLVRSAEPPVWNLSYLSDPELDAMIDGLPLLQATDEQANLDTQRKIQEKVIGEHIAILPTIVYNYQRVMNGDIEGYVDNPLYANVVDVYKLKNTAW